MNTDSRPTLNVLRTSWYLYGKVSESIIITIGLESQEEGRGLRASPSKEQVENCTHWRNSIKHLGMLTA
jgi:hypothetical protein